MNSLGINQFSEPVESTGAIIWSWLGVLLCSLLLVPIGGIVAATASGFRSCSVNNAGLAVTSCGKQSLNSTDFILVGLLIGAVAVAVVTFIHAIRVTRKHA